MASNRTHFFRGLTVFVLIACAMLLVLSLERDPRQREAAVAPKGLVGTPAPGFTLPLLGGGDVDPRQMKGQVVVLDFWAVWCPTCVEELPSVAKIAQRYASRGVKFYAINLTESPDAVRDFLKKHDLSVNVALAKDTSVGQSYGVDYIPQTVVIDRQGIIRHLGTLGADEVSQTLPHWIDSVLEGSLANARD